MADALKAEGNAAIAAKDFDEAVYVDIFLGGVDFLSDWT